MRALRVVVMDELGQHCSEVLLDSGVDLVTLAKPLGHERIETTAVYITPIQQDLGEFSSIGVLIG
jgi:hypothetical protein